MAKEFEEGITQGIESLLEICIIIVHELLLDSNCALYKLTMDVCDLPHITCTGGVE